MATQCLAWLLIFAATARSSPIVPRAATPDVPTCPAGSTWVEYSDDFKQMNTDFWVPTDGMGEDSVVYDAVNGGVTFNVRENMVNPLSPHTRSSKS